MVKIIRNILTGLVIIGGPIFLMWIIGIYACKFAPQCDGSFIDQLGVGSGVVLSLLSLGFILWILYILGSLLYRQDLVKLPLPHWLSCSEMDNLSESQYHGVHPLLYCDNKWYFYDETQSNIFGPFAVKSRALAECKLYIKSL